MELVKEYSEICNTRHAGILKELMKGEYQLVFEFVNKVLLPRSKKRIVAFVIDLFIMESIFKFEHVDLSTLMMEHLYKIVIKHKGKHVMGYGYFQPKVFHHFNILVRAVKIGTSKQSFSLSTLVECEVLKEMEIHRVKYLS